MRAYKTVSKIIALLLVGSLVTPHPAWGLRIQAGLESGTGSVLESRLESGLQEKPVPKPAQTVSEADETLSPDNPLAPYKDALRHYAAKIKSQGGDPLLLAGSLFEGPPPLDPENALDDSPRQFRVVKESPFLKFGPGILYHGWGDLDQALRDGFLTGEAAFFTRVGHQWATMGFHPEAKSPAVFLMDAGKFNDYMDRGEATFGIVGEKESGFIDPYPSIHVPAPLSDFSEIWVSEDAFQRYQNIAAGRVNDPSEGAIQGNVQSLLEKGKLKAVTGLRDEQFRSKKSGSSGFPVGRR